MSLTKDGSQGTSIELLVIRDDHLCKRIIPSQDDVASRLPLDHEANLGERLDGRSSGHPWKSRAQTATTIAEKVSRGTGIPSSSIAPT